MTQTDFPNMPPRYWPILDAYLAYVKVFTGNENFHPRTNLGPSMRAAWKNGARDLYEELRAQSVPESEHAEFVQWACRRLEKNALTNKSPKSLIFLVGTWRANQRVVQLFGHEVEFDEEAMVICEKCEHLVYADRVEEGLCADCRGKMGMSDSYMQVEV
jgi:hypothetical protein